MKLNLTFVRFVGADKELKVVCYGDKDALTSIISGVQEFNICTNVYLSDDKKDEQN